MDIIYLDIRSRLLKIFSSSSIASWLEDLRSDHIHYSVKSFLSFYFSYKVCMFQLLGGNGFLRQIKRLYYRTMSALKVRRCIIREGEVKMHLTEQILEKDSGQYIFPAWFLKDLSFSLRRVSHPLPSVPVFLFPCRWSWLDSSSWESARLSGQMMKKQMMAFVLRSLTRREQWRNTLKPRKKINMTANVAVIPSPGPRLPLCWTFGCFLCSNTHIDSAKGCS